MAWPPFFSPTHKQYRSVRTLSSCTPQQPLYSSLSIALHLYSATRLSPPLQNVPLDLCTLARLLTSCSPFPVSRLARQRLRRLCLRHQATLVPLRRPHSLRSSNHAPFRFFDPFRCSSGLLCPPYLYPWEERYDCPASLYPQATRYGHRALIGYLDLSTGQLGLEHQH